MTEASAMQMVERHGAREVIQVLLGIIKQLKAERNTTAPTGGGRGE